MNKHTKFLIAILCSIILILAAAIARFYWNVSKSSSVISNQIDSLTEIDRSMDVFLRIRLACMVSWIVLIVL